MTTFKEYAISLRPTIKAVKELIKEQKTLVNSEDGTDRDVVLLGTYMGMLDAYQTVYRELIKMKQTKVSRGAISSDELINVLDKRADELLKYANDAQKRRDVEVHNDCNASWREINYLITVFKKRFKL